MGVLIDASRFCSIVLWGPNILVGKPGGTGQVRRGALEGLVDITTSVDRARGQAKNPWSAYRISSRRIRACFVFPRGKSSIEFAHDHPVWVLVDCMVGFVKDQKGNVAPKVDVAMPERVKEDLLRSQNRTGMNSCSAAR